MSDFYEYPDVVQEVRGALNPGRLKLQSTCVTFKNIKTGKVDQYQSSDIEKAYWLKRARGHCLKIVQENGAIHRYDGIKESEFEKLSSFVSKHYNTTLEKVDMSLKGWNWGSTKFEGSALNFMIGSNLAFEIPLNNVSHTTPSKNEVTLEFHQNDDAQVSLMEMRFHIPPDQANPEADNVQEFYRNVLDKADVIQLTGESIAVLTEVQCLTPRGRYDFKMYPTFLQLHGKTFDYKVPYTTVIRLFLLPHKDGRQMFFVVSVDPPVKQGQTRYHFIIMLFNKEEEMTLEMAMDEEEIQKKYEGRLEKTMSGLEHEIISKLFRAVTNRKITVPGNFISHRGVPAVSCSYKASTGLLFPLERGFIFVHKPPIHIRFDEVTFVNFARSAANLRSFDFEVETKMGTNHSFGSIDKDEYGKLYDFVSSKKLRVKNTGGKKDSGGAAYGDDMVDSDMESDGEHDAYLVRMKREGKDRDEFDEDDETDSSDESYNPDASGSDVAEEYDSNPPTSSDSDSDYSDSGSDSGSERREKKEKKKRRSAKTVPEGTIGLKESKPKKTTPKTKGKKKKKDKDQPKRPQSAYFLWLGEHREEIKKENPGINVIDISKKAGEMWKALEDKTEWDKKAAEAKEEYNEAMKEWKKKVAERGDNDEDDESEDEKPKKREKSTKKRSPKKSPSKATESKGGSGAGYKSKEFLSSSGSDSSSDDSDKPLKKKKKEESENSSDAELPEDEAILSSPPVSSESESDSD